MLVTFTLALWLGRDAWFHADEWGFIAGRGLATGNNNRWLEPHNEHWMTAPLVIYKLFYGVWALRTYVPYLVVVALVHLCVMHMTYRLARRAGAEPWPAVAVTAAFGVCAGAPSIVFFPFNVGFAGAAALGLLHILLVDHDGAFDRRDATALLVGLLALMFSGVAIPLLVVSSIVVLVRRGWRAAAATTAPPAAVYVTWFAFWGHHGLKPGRTYDPRAIASYVASGLQATARSWTVRSVFGNAALLLLLAWLIVCCWRWRDPRRRAQSTLQLALAAGVVASFATIAVARASFAPAEAARYAYIATAMLAAPIAVLLTEVLTPARRARRGTLVVAVLSMLAVALPIANGLHAFTTSSAVTSAEQQRLHRFMVSSVAAIRQGEPVIAGPLNIKDNPGVSVDFLRTLSRNNDLGDQGPSEEDKRLAVALL
ncbi:MAG: hypothetical protein QOG30_2343, partial [Acidimicrobiaceae bacterium]